LAVTDPGVAGEVSGVVQNPGAGWSLQSVDYPHPESVLGSSDAIIKGIFETVGEDAGRKVVGANAAAVWGI
jgi:hypothetical protein